MSKLRKDGIDFIVDDKNDDVFKALVYYFSNDPGFVKMGYSFNKGIMLLGPVGCGKTTMMKLFKDNPIKPYSSVHCRQIAEDYADGNATCSGYSIIKKYSKLLHLSTNQGSPILGHFFDDLGTENVVTHYGNQCNVMQEILLNRYDRIPQKNKTHITTNLLPDQIEQYYGARVRSRMREMFNVIVYPSNAVDRRV